eukprot:CAMPEP_0115345932 /NCGR_PEP_ID=MMETSP0270-20121206/94078_1 /TAXON_ID=71861 /ORGANISM="Scrippsiella trochoidea, Strain CCMP3099" /LENGTH=70 /DNA_ID=CAMNT_0002767755 /DNA_START=167 /DNA_END=379 /DNA_ORIENTATION=-
MHLWGWRQVVDFGVSLPYDELQRLLGLLRSQNLRIRFFPQVVSWIRPPPHGLNNNRKSPLLKHYLLVAAD